mmetsp:Transcript_19494/g.55878  ORF Transcript_19494/g.55878 Transcript_19494/m.55878 type:complete len:110 (-) Transcript_19494:126-455(-)
MAGNSLTQWLVHTLYSLIQTYGSRTLHTTCHAMSSSCVRVVLHCVLFGWVRIGEGPWLWVCLSGFPVAVFAQFSAWVRECVRCPAIHPSAMTHLAVVPVCCHDGDGDDG